MPCFRQKRFLDNKKDAPSWLTAIIAWKMLLSVLCWTVVITLNKLKSVGLNKHHFPSNILLADFNAL
jgi:hypothetical protein